MHAEDRNSSNVPRHQSGSGVGRLMDEPLISLSQAARQAPGGPVHLSTIHRWRLRGIKGIKLETCMCGGKRLTSVPAMRRFAIATTAAAVGSVSPPAIDARRQYDIALADRSLSDAGI
jgi:hypothetical protein